MGSSLARYLLFSAALLLPHLSVLAENIPTMSARHLFDITKGSAGALLLPTDIAIDKRGRVYVVDSGNSRVAVFSADGDPLGTISRAGAATGELRDPVGIGIDHNGLVYVADAGNKRIQVFGSNGKFRFGFPTREGGRSIKPIDVAVTPNGNIYVTGNTNHRVMVFNRRGKLLRSWGGEGTSDGQFRYPGTLTIRDGLVYVVDVLNTRVQVFDSSGKYRFDIGEWGVAPGQMFRPKGIALDRRGKRYVSDSYMDLIQVFDVPYRFSHVLGNKGEIQKFTAPAGLAISSGNRIYIAEMLKHKVSVYSLP